LKTKIVKYDKTEGPSGYLVLLRCMLDDLPLAFFHDNPSAIEFAKKVCSNPAELSEQVQETLDLDSTSFLNVTVLRFIGGKPSDYIRYFPVEE
jgi:hypothetical protein